MGGVRNMDNTEIVKMQLHELYMKFLHQQELQEQSESEALLAEIQHSLSGGASLNLTEIHVISCIGQNEPLNVTAIAEKMSISKGNISKICSKLLKEDWIRKTQLSDNKKEVYFRLTAAGKKAFMLHEQLHGRAQQLFVRFLDRYDGEQLSFLKRVLMDGIASLEAGELCIRPSQAAGERES